ncbi:hypothetical protein CHS0354_031797 [Potamilus streckersoni]|uniref:Tetraspanin n=1 Tax=Potamilus streckersoni TaxID=2493646 RepID=A0AAE0RXL6_9BIVA|nr:hypothetical protein CHS0354_031797 [Potamilus streckersoni]
MAVSCLKIAMFVDIGLLVLIGAASIGVGIWAHLDETIQRLQLPDYLKVLDVGSKVNIGVGAFVILLGIVGCIGSSKEVTCLLWIFFICLMLIVVLMVTIGVIIFISKDLMHDIVKFTLKQSVEDYFTVPAGKSFMDFIQKKFDCCGHTNGLADYNAAALLSGGTVESCKLEYITTPCTEKVKNFILSNLNIFAGVPIGISSVPMIGMIFSMIMICQLRK